MWTSRYMRFCRLLAAASLITIAIVGPAVAAVIAKPQPGKTYSGLIKQSSTLTYPIRFKVSASGKTVRDFQLKIGAPRYRPCYNITAYNENVTAKISRKGTFTAKLRITDGYDNPEGTLTVTGKFGKNGHESGTATSTYGVAACDGSSPYTTKAK